METNVLKYVKGYLGYSDDDSSFDSDILAMVNLSVGMLNQLGAAKIINVENTTVWDQFVLVLPDEQSTPISLVTAYVCLKVKVLFDPPAPTTLNYMDRELTALESRIQIAWDPHVRKGVKE